MEDESRPKRDRLDLGEPRQKAWEEFAVQFSGARLLSWLLAELDELAPHFFEELKDKFHNAYSESDFLADESEDWDRDWVTLETPSFQYLTDRAGGAELYEQVFPHADRDIAMEHVGRGLALVGLQAALEHYLSSVSGASLHGEFPKRVRDYLATTVDGRLYSDLITLDETRHVVIHHRSVISDRYVANVPYGRLLVGERREISNAELWNVGDLVWRLALQIRREAERRVTRVDANISRCELAPGNTRPSRSGDTIQPGLPGRLERLAVDQADSPGAYSPFRACFPRRRHTHRSVVSDVELRRQRLAAHERCPDPAH